MRLSASRKSNGLPKRFPVGTTYVVEGRGGEDGQLRVFSRYVVLPGGERINLNSDFAGPALPRCRAAKRGGKAAQKPPSARAKKMTAGSGTARRARR